MDEDTPLSWPIIASNITEAREELENIERRIASGDFDEVEFQIAMQHAFHHLNFAWNVRKQPIERYAGLSQADFDQWGSFPTDLAFDD
jgi:hypothetical protein